MIQVTTTGDWKKCGMLLKALATELYPVCKARLYEDGKVAVETMQEHIDRQDLPWDALSEVTTRLKEDERIYIETGYLRENIGVRKIKSSANEISYFVGASPWKTHKPSGKKFSDIMMYMEYGTIKQPPRPLVRPTYEEIQAKMKKEWSDYLKSVIRGGNI